MSASKRAQDAAEIIYPVYSWVKSSLGRTENHQRLSELAKKIGRPPKMIRYWMRHKVIPFVRIKKVVFFEEAKVRRALDEMHTAWEALIGQTIVKNGIGGARREATKPPGDRNKALGCLGKTDEGQDIA